MIEGQLELSLSNARGCQPLGRRQRHLSRARWWFDRMRRVVDRAMDWAPAPPARPEQIWFPQASMPALPAPGAGAAPRFDEHEVCE